MANWLTKAPFFKDCYQYNIPLWQCPSFLFLILGLFNIAAMVSTYIVSTRFTEEPEITALMTIFVSLVIFIIGYTIVHGFDKLAEANKMKTEFIRIASHQLRTPLSSLRWSVNMLNDGTIGPPNEEQKEYLKIIEENNLRMIKLINDLLDVSKIEMGNVIIDLKPVDLKSIAEEVIKELTPLAKANNVAIDLNFPHDLPAVLSDEEKIKMVLLNLIDNAIKYIEGEGKVEVAGGLKDGYIEVSVRDTGVGIPKDQQKNIFQKFFRSDNAMKHRTVGTGLGLFIVKAIIDASHGKIWFQSQESKGTTFYFRIPIAK